MSTPAEQGIQYFSRCKVSNGDWHGPHDFNESHAEEIDVPLEHMTEAHCNALIQKWSRPITGWEYRIHKVLKKQAKAAISSPVQGKEPPKPKLQTWGSVYLNGKISDHLSTVQRLKDAGYSFTYRPHPDVATRADYYQYDLCVVFDLYNLGTYTPA